jgi:hypothetical protein
LNAASAVSGSPVNAGRAGDSAGRLQRWNATEWKEEKSGTDNVIYSIAGYGVDETWLVGGKKILHHLVTAKGQ